MHAGGPNPWKVAIVLEELGLEYHSIFINTSTNEHKQAPYTNLNPNGRMPTLVDHSNNNFTIWESGAIILYLVGKYDKDNKISFKEFDTTAIANQYLMFQMSGQGPYFGQAAWFSRFHPEKIPSAIERYTKEIRRVISVLENILATGDKEYLVNDKCSYADLAFITWNWGIDYFPELAGWREEFPKVAAWDVKLNDRPTVKKVKGDKAKAMGAH